MKLTQSSILKLEIPITGQKLYYDENIKGFGVRVTSKGTQSYFVEKRIGTKVKRITLSRVNELSLKDAAKESKKILGKISLGKDPFKKEKVSLSEIFEMYLKTRKNLKPSTLYHYNRILTVYLKEWKNINLLSITKQMVLEKHIEIEKNYDPASANISMKILRALYHFYQSIHSDVAFINPVNVLRETKAWYTIKPRTNYIKKDQLSKWYHSLYECHSTTRDYLLFILMTGLRRQEAATLKWENVNFGNKTFSIITEQGSTKNGTIHELPLTDFTYKLLYYRPRENEYVFSGSGKKGYILNPRVTINKVKKETDIIFSIHDLRRTFATIAESLDISAYAIKRLLNHTSKNDVTSQYIVHDVERLRKPLELINQFILDQFNLNN